MTNVMLESLRAEFERLSAALDRPMEGPDRAAVRAAIVALFKRTETAIGELAEFKEGIRDLVQRVKALPDAAPQASIRHDHLGASTFIERGWSELAAGNWSAAETVLRQAVAMDGTSGAAQALLGWALMHQGRFEEAIAPCASVLQRDANHGLARVGMGAICLRKGMVDEALGHLARATGPGADSRAALFAHYWQGVAHLERDRYPAAIESLRQAVTLGPNLAEAWVELGRALWFDTRQAEAREAWMVGAGIRHSQHAARCTALLTTVSAGGTPPRSSFT